MQDWRFSFKIGRNHFIVTNRRKEEGGKYRGEERKRLGVLQEAIDLGADYIDVELATRKVIASGFSKR